jgi:D-glycero-D-manno-heptose 1,7-bisphosphate phosphatase
MSESARPAVFFDRDGVLIKAPIEPSGKPGAIRDVADLEFTRDAKAVCATLTERGIPIFLFTNQPDVERGLTTREAVDAINGKVQSELALTEIAVCWSNDDEAPCRKPNPGMLLDLAEKHGLDLAASVAVGDRWRDIAAGQRAGAQTLFIDRHYGEQHPKAPDHTVAELGDGLDWILEHVTASA